MKAALLMTWIVTRMLLALPVRAVGWLFAIVGMGSSGVARLVAWIADRIEGKR